MFSTVTALMHDLTTTTGTVICFVFFFLSGWISILYRLVLPCNK